MMKNSFKKILQAKLQFLCVSLFLSYAFHSLVYICLTIGVSVHVHQQRAGGKEPTKDDEEGIRKRVKMTWVEYVCVYIYTCSSKLSWRGRFFVLEMKVDKELNEGFKFSLHILRHYRILWILFPFFLGFLHR